MMTHILILMTADTLMAVDIGEDGRDEYVSLDGNTSMIYRDRSGIEQFDLYIRDHYNIDRYEEGKFSLLVLQCGANAADAQYLYSLLAGASEFGTIDIRYILPLAAVALGLVKKGGETHLSVLGMRYTVFTDERGMLKCQVLEDNAVEVQMLQPGQLGFLFRLEARMFAQNIDLLLEAVRQEEKVRTEEIIRKWQEEEETYKNQEAALKFIIDVQRESAKEQREAAAKQAERIAAFERKEKNAKRCIVRFGLNAGTGSNTGSIIGTMRSLEYRIQLNLSDGDIVQALAPIASVKTTYRFNLGGGNGYPDIPVTAPQGGRIFCLVGENATIEDGDAIAIIGDLADTWADAVNWYNAVKNTNTGDSGHG